VVEAGQLPMVMGKPPQLTQVFQNLIGNGLKFCKEGQPEVRVSAERQGGEWVFSVSDNGIGIDQQYADRIFLIFQRLHKRDEYEGTGIGLAICKKIVERHGGRIWVESEPGKGASFRFTLQMVDELEAARMNLGDELVDILLVEDNPGDVRLTREALKEAKFRNELHVVCDGVEAVDYLRRRGAFASVLRPHLILLDLNLPRKDGREVLAEIKNDPDLRRIPVRRADDLGSRSGHPEGLRPARQLLHLQAGRHRPVHDGGQGDRGLLGHDRESPAPGVIHAGAESSRAADRGQPW